MASTTLTRTVSSAGNRKTFTYSAWIKRSNVSSGQGIFGQGDRSSSDFDIRFESSGTLRIEPSGFDIKTNQVFRDTNGWYHIVVAIDTTQATSTDRVKIYVNGEQVTSLANTTYPSLNYDTVVNSSGSTGNVVLGDVFNATGKFNGSMAHVHLTDGTAYDASAFGETDSTTGIWKPKTAPSVTYGTNGFFLKFENSGAFGTDSSGNGNTFTVNGTMTQTIDTPSNVFATMNPLGKSPVSSPNLPTFSNGNLTVAMSSDTFAYSTLGVSQGKWYFEYKQTENAADNQGYPLVGINTTGIGTGGDTIGFRTPDGSNYRGTIGTTNVDNAFLSARVANDIFGFYIDLDNSTLIIHKNGSTYMNTGYESGLDWSGGLTTTNTQTGFYFPFVQSNTANAFTDHFNFGNGFFGTTAVSSGNADANGHGIFEYSPTLGGTDYFAICTKNINAEEYS
jgi:hypothetical protein